VLRRRFPGIFAFYKRWVRRHIARGDPHYAIASWVNVGLALRQRLALADVCFDRDGVWFVDGRGLQWQFDPGIWGSALGAATGGVHESAELDAVCQRLDRSSVVVDVGANIGAFAIPVTKATGARVIAIEPVSSTFALLVANIARNGAGDFVTTVHSAIGDAAGNAVMTTDAQSANHVLVRQTTARVGEERIAVTTLDRLLAREPRIDLIKVDVEGLELKVLLGARKTLEDHAPTVLLEIESRWTTRYGYQPQDIFDFMTDAGYAYQTMNANGARQSTSIESDLREANNFLFTSTRSGRADESQRSPAG